MCRGAAMMSQHPICFFIAMYPVPCGSIPGLGLAGQVLILTILVSISFSLRTIQVIRRLINLYYNLFGFYVSAWFGMSAITGYLITLRLPFYD